MEAVTFDWRCAMKSGFQILLCLFAASVLLCSCATAPPPGSPATGYSIYGFVGTSTTSAASNTMVMLLDGDTERPVDSANTNLLGKYTISGVAAGYYKLRVGKITKEILVKDENVRLDVDLSAEDGTMNYLAGAMKGTSAPGKPGGDPALVQALAGKYWGYSGTSSYSGGGGTETRMAFCMDGSYHDSSESSYYGSTQDQYGDENMVWGAANQSAGSGSWSVQGTPAEGTITISYHDGSEGTIEYRAGDEAGTYYFDGKLCSKTGSCP